MNDQLGMPQQCQDTGKAFVTTYGYNRAINVIERKITTLRKAHALIEYDTHMQLKIDLACDVDFWSQTKEAIKLNK